MKTTDSEIRNQALAILNGDMFAMVATPYGGQWLDRSGRRVQIVRVNSSGEVLAIVKDGHGIQSTEEWAAIEQFGVKPAEAK